MTTPDPSTPSDTPESSEASTPEDTDAGFVVALGSSAGGLDAITAFFRHMPPGSGMAFVVIPHLSMHEKSQLASILRNHTPMTVTPLQNGDTPQPDTVHVLPSRQTLRIRENRFVLTDPDPHLAIHHPIDIFFESLAMERRNHAIGIILSGTGHDGMRGIRAIKQHGGFLLAQTPETAAFDGMPRSAISTGILDAILPPEQMATRLLQYKIKPGARHPFPAPHPPDADYDACLNAILELIRNETGMDFSRYKRNTLCRRIDRYIHIHQRESIRAYLQLLKHSPKDVQILSRELLIGVTRFFRDPDAFAFLRTRILPPLVQHTPPDQPIRIWVSACSTGEEAYSIAILLHDYLAGIHDPHDFHILATDIDTRALATAAAGSYPASIASDVDPVRLQQHFTQENGRYTVNPALRARITFTPHDFTRPPPCAGQDLITCRNILIYLQVTLQREILASFQSALRPEGYLFLGTSESIGNLSESFTILDPKWKLFRKKPAALQVMPPPRATWDSPPHAYIEAARKHPLLHDFLLSMPPLSHDSAHNPPPPGPNPRKDTP